ncbi:zinc ABC transporter substrate-binding protein [Marivivens aquimaris]|uniref:zinc ABC transporter substrate-binding protein n=1 Tax=Marivivens aquimaris TaxID=2774876 RepID=UPI00187F1C5A|nr:zinc ABC transporter substrate-binding protein [Marivivens aquimaris]
MIRMSAVFALLATTASADPLTIVTDIAPVRSLVEAVAGDNADVGVLLPPGASPHDYAMRPSEARMLTNADIVFWIGEGLTPFLEAPIESLAANATSVEFLHADGWEPLPMREFHDEEEDEHHDHGSLDPHAWLSPSALIAWAGIVAETLSATDPENAESYRKNADAFVAEVDAINIEAIAFLTDVQDGKYVVSHDGFQYFETAFDMPSTDMIALSDASNPGAAHLAALRDRVAEEGVTCILTDTQTNLGWAELVAEGQDVRFAVVDPLGAALPADEHQATAIILDTAKALSACLKG